ncbi:phosphatidylinositol 4-phosphate 5-kinase 2-like [Abrus precatorius]|uniref:Phosphatidylinositol 4-phosphate 5-kinase 2-like n=1 Tax=Abrus precatorius TaxID=3816 RepID=A0A8B8JLA3_ABRPR|nr:phosphatidylinositol 4-phosphate 5-kinase 2-like [Abrus precatorius]
MEAPKKKTSQTKLTRTQSSLLRCSSPTTRSSVHSLSSVNEDFFSEEEESQKKRKKPKPIKPGSIRFVTGPVLGFFTAGSVFSYFFFFYLGTRTSPSSENVLVVLVFLAVALYFVNRNKGLIQRTVSVLKHSWDGNLKRLGFSSKGSEKPVQWFIGDATGSVGRGESKSKNSSKRVAKEGVEFYSNGDFYEGEFHEGKCNGSGVYHYYVSGRYEGDWVDGRYDGYGIESWARGSRYKGCYRQGLRHGFGVYKFYTGDTYAGEWCNGQSHGVGVQSCSDGSCYVGEFKYGVKHGLGCYHFRNGDRYAGEYFGDKIHGFGVYHFANGHCYEGAWHEGRRQGYGVYTFRSGERRCGEWDTGNLKHSLPPLNDSILRAVQAARKTAENAINLPRKDEQVSKAVIAANRAATAARVAAVKAVQNRMGGKFCNIDV